MPRVLVLAALAVLLAACESDEPQPSESIADAAEAIQPLPATLPPGSAPSVSGATVVDVVAEAPGLTTLRRLVGLWSRSGIAMSGSVPRRYATRQIPSRARSSGDRASGFYPQGRGFESSRARM